MSLPIRQRFEEKFIPVPEVGCWLWLAFTDSAGYGSFYFTAGRSVSAHRAAYLLYRGEIPEGFDVCHHCDVPPCVNPYHLFLGTRTQNMQDMIRKGRQWRSRKGEQS